MNAAELKTRTKQLALRIIRLCSAIPANRATYVLSRQLLRCGTSVGANYRAVCRARSTADFVAKLASVEEEVDECSYWIELLVESGQVKAQRVAALLRELDELTAIVSSSRKTARSRINRQSKIANRQSESRRP